jgi:xanthosine utilization system XapX-like protein
MWAVTGQLLTIGFLFGEFVVRSYVALPSIGLFSAVVIFVGFALATFCWRNVKACAPPPPPKKGGCPAQNCGRREGGQAVTEMESILTNWSAYKKQGVTL